MAKSLIIVESPAKTKTLKNFLGSDYLIEASMGHVRDLPEHRLGVDVKKDFAPTYQPLPDRAEVLERLASAAKKVHTVYLASDPDREGEAIAWHLVEALHLEKKEVRRIQFNEITQTAVQQALANPRTVDMDRVNAQQARRVLDRLIGYKLSPVLSAKIQKGLSAGRVQSVAVRLICEREREILAFVPEEYWSLTATLTPIAPEKRFPFPARLHSRAGKKLEPKTEAEITEILDDLKGAHYLVGDVKRREQKRNPAAPFITSTLQQEASRKLGFGNKRTMSVAQQLYEGIELKEHGSVGLITYMRTDSVRVAAEAQEAARQFIAAKYGPAYVPATGKQFKSKGEAQDAHEAIRPTHVEFEPDLIARDLTPEQLKLYRLIWQRFLASQMNPAVMDVTTADINAQRTASGVPTPKADFGLNAPIPTNTLNTHERPTPESPVYPIVFRASGTVIKFDGFMRVYMEGKDTEEETDEERPPLPPLAVEQPLDLIKLDPRQHFTEPPPRYTEATIVKALEERGIGRPSTYASIISVIRDRKYVELTDKRFFPTELGFKVTDQLVKHFPSVMDVTFTADMETKLDEVAEGRVDWISLLRDFYDPFALLVANAKVEMENLKPQPIETEFHCQETGKVMVIRQGRFGPFMGCSGYPECKKILKVDAEGNPVEGPNFPCGLHDTGERTPVDPSTLPNATQYVCPNHQGVMLTRQGRFGSFLGCSSYPKCKTVLKTKPDGTLQEGQEFACTYNENAGKKGAKSEKKATASKATTKTTKTTAEKATTAKTTARKTPVKTVVKATDEATEAPKPKRATATKSTATKTASTTARATSRVKLAPTTEDLPESLASLDEPTPIKRTTRKKVAVEAE